MASKYTNVHSTFIGNIANWLFFVLKLKHFLDGFSEHLAQVVALIFLFGEFHVIIYSALFRNN